ncbi:hypothetical protein ACFOWX_12225 [Sphingorhabdus arenilitoris]|uniref:Uncharacterized protein n=1 Tax=Sphingorhabdus arenilitoris TaxID=1490041 RepID=A0ABV8RJE5_9SPHN
MKFPIYSALTSIALAMASPPCFAQNTPMQNQELFDRIDKDMSRFPFDMKEEEAQKLKIEGVTYNQDEDDFGVLIDETGVLHNFYDGLYGKSIEIDPSAIAQPIKALGIGLARSQKEVLAAFSEYSGGKQLECDYSYDSDGPKKVRLSDEVYCNFTFDNEYDAGVGLTFDGKDQLVRVYVQAWNPF